MTSTSRRNDDADHSDDDGPELDDGDASKALKRWRDAVLRATSAAQLTLCLLRLQNSIAWEKSIMKVVWKRIFIREF